MIRKLFKLLLVLVVGILLYNFFLGTPAEKEGAKKIFKEVKDVAVGVHDLLKSEREKFDSGKYDQALDRVGDMLSKLKSNAQEFDEKYIDRIDELNKKRRQLRDELAEYDREERRDTSSRRSRKRTEESSKLRKELQDLLRDTESLIGDMEKK